MKRIERCFCGSGRHFKHCHGALSIHHQDPPIANWHQIPQRVRDAFDRQQMNRLESFERFGFQRPALIAKVGDDRLIVRGGQVLRWDKGGTFLNFLESDLLKNMGEDLLKTDHPIFVWWRAMREQARNLNEAGISHRLTPTVAAVNFFTVAYDLFVVADNALLRERLLKSLRVPDQFHGARYELMIAACLIRAGFRVEFSDENQLHERHPDLTAQHRKSGRYYSVEMKAKGRHGILGKPIHGAAPVQPNHDVSRLLRKALLKPADYERLILIDMNLPPASSKDALLSWQNGAAASVKAVQSQPGKLPPGVSAFVVFTNLPSLQMPLDELYIGLERAFTGFNKPDFAEGMPTLKEAYPDIADLFQAFSFHHDIPNEF
jgi:hypothetical protein